METMELERMDDFFNARAGIYDHHMLVDLALDDFYGEIAEWVRPVRADFRLLDLGCGTGLELARLFEKYPGMQVTGIDLSAEMLALLREKFPDRPMRLIRGSYFEVDFGGPYDIVLSTYSLHHFTEDEKRRLYRKIHGALATGGTFVFGDYTVASQAQQAELMAECARIRQEHGAPGSGLYHLDIPFTAENEVRLMQEAGFPSAEAVRRWEHASAIIARA